MAQLIELKLINSDYNENNPGLGLWRWIARCPCGQLCQGQILGTEREAKKDIGTSVCNTCYSEAMCEADSSYFDDDEE